jgi:metal-sulfur cluster biosynthetic enzyme
LHFEEEEEEELTHQEATNQLEQIAGVELKSVVVALVEVRSVAAKQVARLPTQLVYNH